MGDVATLITAIAALVTAIGGATAAVILALRSGGRQRVAAAEEAARLGQDARQRGSRGDRDAGPRHRRATDSRGDALVARLEQALEVARAADEVIDLFDDADPGLDGDNINEEEPAHGV
jgi:hypothetical protein